MFMITMPISVEYNNTEIDISADGQKKIFIRQWTWQTHTASQWKIDMIVMDFSKAFDKVSHNKLISSLHEYGIDSTTLE